MWVSQKGKKSSAITEGPHKASCQLKLREISHKCPLNCICKSCKHVNDLQGYPGSLEMARIDRLFNTSCKWCVVTTCLSCTISLTLPLLQCMWLPVGGHNLEKSFIFGKQLRLKTTDTFPFTYTHNVVNMCHIHWQTGVRQVLKQLKWQPSSLKLTDIGAIRQDTWFSIVFHISILYRFWDFSTYFRKF